MDQSKSKSRPLRFLNTHTLRLEQPVDEEIEYAILSHTWGAEEITLQDWENGIFYCERQSEAETQDTGIKRNRSRASNLKEGFQKISGACSQAKKDELDYIWVDTCCIDKTNNAELSTAITSMYAWYQNAARCYAFLADVDHASEGVSQQFRASRWFTRGWTLQELLAPTTVSFYTSEWVLLGSADSLASEISQATGIPAPVISHEKSFRSCTAGQRLSWAARRETQLLEDRSYSLFGILDVRMPLMYGEGDGAFKRLQEAILRTTNDLSILAWSCGEPDRAQQLFASDLEAFVSLDSCETVSSVQFKGQSYSLNNVGLQGTFPVLAGRCRNSVILSLGCYHSQQPQDVLALQLQSGEEGIHSIIPINHPGDHTAGLKRRVTCINFNQFSSLEATQLIIADHPISHSVGLDSEVTRSLPSSSSLRRAFSPGALAQTPPATSVHGMIYRSEPSNHVGKDKVTFDDGFGVSHAAFSYTNPLRPGLIQSSEDTGLHSHWRRSETKRLHQLKNKGTVQSVEFSANLCSQAVHEEDQLAQHCSDLDIASEGASRSKSEANAGDKDQVEQHPVYVRPTVTVVKGARMVCVKDPRSDVMNRLVTGPSQRITDPVLFRRGVHAHRLHYDPWPGASLLYQNYKPRKPSFFVMGRVFSILWVPQESTGEDVTVINSVIANDGEQAGRLRGLVYSMVRRFVVIRQGANVCSALPILTYAGRGVAGPRPGALSPGPRKSDHAIIYTSSTPPSPMNAEAPSRGERPMRTRSIRVVPSEPYARLDTAARVNFAAIHTVHYNLKVAPFGMVHEASRDDLARQFTTVWEEARPDNQKTSAVGRVPEPYL